MKLHSEARTTPKLRCEIKASSLTQTALAKQYNVSRLTIRKWQNREEMTDKSHRPDTLHTTLTEAQEWLVVELRKTLLLSLDDLTHITKATSTTVTNAAHRTTNTKYGGCLTPA